MQFKILTQWEALSATMFFAFFYKSVIWLSDMEMERLNYIQNMHVFRWELKKRL